MPHTTFNVICQDAEILKKEEELFELVNKIDNKLDSSDSKNFKKALTKSIEILGKRLVELGYLKNLNQFNKDPVLNGIVESVKLERMILNCPLNTPKQRVKSALKKILLLKSADFILCLEFLKKHSNLNQKELSLFTDFFIKYRAYMEIEDEIVDFNKDLKNGNYNAIIIMKKFNIPLSFMEKFLDDLVSEIKTAVKTINDSDVSIDMKKTVTQYLGVLHPQFFLLRIQDFLNA